ncbi:Uncharacterised protein [Acinetobacter baumannii]|nr:Uncharacterised protein [Acinetobacter baumannii]
MHHLQCLAALLAEGSTQPFMALDQCGEAALQGLDIQFATQAQGRRDMVGRAVGLQLPEEPLALLGIRQRVRARLLAHAGNGHLQEADALGAQPLIEQFPLRQRQPGETSGKIGIVVEIHIRRPRVRS